MSEEIASLKALAYDKLVLLEQTQRDLNMINQKIVQLSQVKEDKP